jgi:hypothetical protein
MNFASEYDIALLLRLLTAHLISDFIIQTDALVKRRFEKKWLSGWLYFHGIIAGLLTYCLAWRWDVIWLPIAVAVSHILIDGFKSQAKDTARSFLLDQLVHLILIVIFWGILENVNWSYVLWILIGISLDVKVWIVIVAYLAILWPVGYGIGKITTPWRQEIESETTRGLKNAGLWIGRLERVLILTFVLLKQFEAIGFLIAAKSIFRFSEIKDPEHRKEAEYILIGTMLSFTLAIILGVFVSWVLGLQI